MAEQTYERRLRNLVVDEGLQLRYVLLVTGIAVVIAVALGFLIVQQSAFASEQIIKALHGEGASWLDQQARDAVIAQLGQTDAQLVITMVALGVGLTLVVIVSLVLITHRMAGPLYRMRQQFQRLRQGQLSSADQLRRRDQFHNVFDSLRSTQDALCERARADIAVMTDAIEAAERTGNLSPRLRTAVEELRKVVAEKSASL